MGGKEDIIPELLDNAKDRIQIIIEAYKECHTVRRESETKETRLTLSAATVICAVVAYSLNIFKEINLSVFISIAIFILIIAIGVTFFLYENNKRIKYSIRIIVRIEEVLGFYEPNLYIKTNNEENSIPIVFPLSAKKWGLNNDRLLNSSHIVFIWLISLVTILLMLLNFLGKENI